jgi:mannonate dehydratase
LRIRDVKTILTAPYDIRLVVAEVLTTEPELCGLDYTTFTERPLAVVGAVEKYLRPFLAGKDLDRIEVICQSSFASCYWRSGPAINNALNNVDMASWDIKGKAEGAPVH